MKIAHQKCFAVLFFILKYTFITCLLFFVLDQWIDQELSALMKMSIEPGKELGKSINSFILIVTANGLLLAGAISGYFQFSFKNSNRRGGGDLALHKFIGHLTTGLNLLIIGVLMLVAYHCLSLYFPDSGLIDDGFSYVLLALYAAMIFYDLYDAWSLE
ncbi:MAG: hypothetical protein KJO08_08475 [Gammaproteobacteria bacterium]|nr:hypothetical protein [Gammaproteobacteria bacterium]NNJ83644.1 hypothetical protein [Gammaproteobacteria bacterium]